MELVCRFDCILWYCEHHTNDNGDILMQEQELLDLINAQIDLIDQYKNRNWFKNPPQTEKEWAIMENQTGEV